MEEINQCEQQLDDENERLPKWPQLLLEVVSLDWYFLQILIYNICIPITQVGTAARGGLRSHFVANRAWKSQVGLVKLLVFGFPGLKALTNIL